MSHEGGGEHSADRTDKAIRVPTAKALSGRRNRDWQVRGAVGIPAWVHPGRIRFASVQGPGRQLMRILNWMVNDGLGDPVPVITPAGWTRMARTLASKPFASGTGV